MDTYHWDVLVTYQWDVVGCFIWDLFETSWRRNDKTSLLRPLESSSQRSNKMSWRRTAETSWKRSIEASLGVLFEAHLRRCWDVQRDAVMTSPQHLVSRWVMNHFVSTTFSSTSRAFLLTDSLGGGNKWCCLFFDWNSWDLTAD